MNLEVKQENGFLKPIKLSILESREAGSLEVTRRRSYLERRNHGCNAQVPRQKRKPVRLMHG